MQEAKQEAGRGLIKGAELRRNSAAMQYKKEYILGYIDRIDPGTKPRYRRLCLDVSRKGNPSTC